MDEESIQTFKNFIRQFIDIPDDQVVSLMKSATILNYKPNEYFSTPDKPSPFLGFVVKGLFRQYVIDREGNEVVREFRGDNNIMACYAAVILNKYQPIYIQAIEDSLLYAIPRTEFLKMWETDVKWKDLLQKHTELDCLKLRKREFGFLMEDAKTRYLNFLKDYEPFAERIKQYDIASYLGITPETLSRIRSSPM
jgi:CRP-like cAMP-binding protein